MYVNVNGSFKVRFVQLLISLLLFSSSSSALFSLRLSVAHKQLQECGITAADLQAIEKKMCVFLDAQEFTTFYCDLCLKYADTNRDGQVIELAPAHIAGTHKTHMLILMRIS